MPTAIEPKTEEPKPQPVSNEPELFAAEIAMEKRSFGFLPLLLAIALLVIIGGSIIYWVKGSYEVLSTSTANTTVSGILKQQGAFVRFSVGDVDPTNGQQDPLYKLLTRAGVVVSKPKGKQLLAVALTEPGQSLVSSIDGVQTLKHGDGTTSYRVPLAERQVVSIDKVTLLKPHLAKVDYTWKWVPNRLGREFNAESDLVKSFTEYDRQLLIKSYAVDFYTAPPAKASIVLREGNDNEWMPYSE